MPSREADTLAYTNDSNGVLMRTVPTTQVPGTSLQPASTVSGWLMGSKGPPLSHLQAHGGAGRARPVGCCLVSMGWEQHGPKPPPHP